MTQKSHEDMSKEINKDGVAVRTRGISYMESYILYNRRAGNADVHISGA